MTGPYTTIPVHKYQELVDAVKEAAEAAYEDSARIVESQIIWTPDHVALLIEKIRARAKESK